MLTGLISAVKKLLQKEVEKPPLKSNPTTTMPAFIIRDKDRKAFYRMTDGTYGSKGEKGLTLYDVQRIRSGELKGYTCSQSPAPPQVKFMPEGELEDGPRLLAMIDVRAALDQKTKKKH